MLAEDERAASGEPSRPDSMPATPNDKWLRKLLVRLGISLAIAAFFIWLLRAGALPMLPTAQALSVVQWWTVPAYMAVWSGVHVLRAARWKFLLQPIAEVSMRRILSASFIGFFAILVLPLRAGEVVRPVMIRERGQLSAWAAAGTIAAERIVDGLTLCLMLFFALQLATPLDPLPERLGDLPISVAVIPRAAYLALLMFAAALLAMIVFHVWHRPARRLLQSVFGIFSPRAGVWVADRVASVAEGVSFLSRWRSSVPFVLATIVYWLLNSASLGLLAWGVGFRDFDLIQACVTTGVLALGILVPNAPGFFGAFQFSLYAGLALFYPREQVLSTGAACVFLLYVSQLVLAFGFALLGLRLGNRTWLGRLRPSALGTPS
jgi:glycosyltransferase 2 family protein